MKEMSSEERLALSLNLEDFDFGKQIETLHAEFIPNHTKLANGTYIRVLVDSDWLEWIELSPDAKDDDSSSESGEDLNENPLDEASNRKKQ